MQAGCVWKEANDIEKDANTDKINTCRGAGDMQDTVSELFSSSFLKLFMSFGQSIS